MSRPAPCSPSARSATHAPRRRSSRCGCRPPAALGPRSVRKFEPPGQRTHRSARCDPRNPIRAKSGPRFASVQSAQAIHGRVDRPRSSPSRRGTHRPSPRRNRHGHIPRRAHHIGGLGRTVDAHRPRYRDVAASGALGHLAARGSLPGALDVARLHVLVAGEKRTWLSVYQKWRGTEWIQPPSLSDENTPARGRESNSTASCRVRRRLLGSAFSIIRFIHNHLSLGESVLVVRVNRKETSSDRAVLPMSERSSMYGRRDAVAVRAGPGCTLRSTVEPGSRCGLG